MSVDPAKSFQLPETLEPMVLMSASAAELTADELPKGTAGNDLIISLTPDELIDGAAGHDIMIALGGNNVLRGGAGHDTLISVRGDNVLDGGAGVDKAVYWNGNRADFTVTDHGFGIYEIAGSKNSDFITNIEQVQFQDGVYSIAELLTGNTNAPALGTESQDAAEQTVDSLKTPTTGNDVLVANAPGESIDALAGDDLVVGLGNGNTILGSEGTDAIVSAGGNSFIDGGAGTDTVVYGGVRSGYTVESAAGGTISVTSANGQDILKNVERLSFEDQTIEVASLNLTPVVDVPIVDVPVVDVPVVDVPVVDVPVVDVPVVDVPVVEEPVVEVPVVEEPVVEEPVVDVPIFEVPVIEVPVDEEVEVIDLEEEPVEEVPVEETPIEVPVTDGGTISFSLPMAGDLYATVSTNPDLRYELVTAPAVGSINFYPDGTFDFHAPVGFVGNVTFEYRIVAADGSVAVATLVIGSSAPVEPPVEEPPVEEPPVEEVPVEEPPVEEIDGLVLDPDTGINLVDTDGNGSVTVTFEKEAAGYQNTIGSYLINNTTGEISDVRILFANASQPGSGGSMTSGTDVTVASKAGYSVGFFLLADGNSKNNLNSLAGTSLSLESAAIGGLKLVATKADGQTQDLNGYVYISTHPGMNPDGKDHFRFVEKGDLLQISVEDLFNLGDKDFDDVVLSVDLLEEIEFIDLDEPADPADDQVEVIELDDEADPVVVEEEVEEPVTTGSTSTSTSYSYSWLGSLFSWWWC